MVRIGDIVQAKRADGDYFYGAIEEVRRDIQPDDSLYIRYAVPGITDSATVQWLNTHECAQTQYRVRSIKHGDSIEEWSASVVTYDALRRWGGPIPWIEDWIKTQ